MKALYGLGASLIGSRIVSYLNQQHIAVIHALPGRLRLGCKEWKSKETASLLESQLQGHPEIARVEVSPITGTALIEFNKTYLTSDELDKIVRFAVDITARSYAYREPKMVRALKNTLHFIDGNVKTRTKGLVDTRSLLILFLVGKGFTQFKKNKPFATSLLLWAYGMVSDREDQK